MMSGRGGAGLVIIIAGGTGADGCGDIDYENAACRWLQ